MGLPPISRLATPLNRLAGYVTLLVGRPSAQMIEVQCKSCHTRYRIDEQVLPEGTPTFKCSRCGHVFSTEPRATAPTDDPPDPLTETKAAEESRAEAQPAPQPAAAEGSDAPERSASEKDSGDKPAAESKPKQDTAGPSQPAEVQARRTEEFFSKLFAEEKKDELDSSDNLAFDFTEEPSPEQAQTKATSRGPEPDLTSDAGKWEVGDSSTFDDPVTVPQEVFRAGNEPRRRKRPEPQPADEHEFVDEDAAPIFNRDITHSARFFLMMFMLVGLGFGAATLLIHNAPATASELLSRFPVVGSRFQPPSTPARLVALRGVQADYQRGKDGRLALVVTGDAENVGSEPLHVIQIEARLRDASQRPVASQDVYCGNNLTPRMAAQMTPHEIAFFQRLDPPKTFALEPAASCQFVIVFVDPPAGANSFAISVEQAVPAVSEAPQTPSF